MTAGFERYSKKTRREIFLEEMEQVVPWRIIPSPATAAASGSERMLRIIFCSSGSTCRTRR
jgi:hypothetical protein